MSFHILGGHWEVKHFILILGKDHIGYFYQDVGDSIIQDLECETEAPVALPSGIVYKCHSELQYEHEGISIIYHLCLQAQRQSNQDLMEDIGFHLQEGYKDSPGISLHLFHELIIPRREGWQRILGCTQNLCYVLFVVVG